MTDLLAALKKSKIPEDKLSTEQVRILQEIFDASNDENMAIERMEAYYQSGRISNTVILKMSKVYDELGPQVDGIYQHVEKPIQVKVIANGIDEATMEHVVIYHHIPEPVIWTRPAESFKKRFKFVKFEPRKIVPVASIRDVCIAMTQPENYFRRKAEVEGNRLDGMMIIRLIENYHWYQSQAEKILDLLKD